MNSGGGTIQRASAPALVLLKLDVEQANKMALIIDFANTPGSRSGHQTQQSQQSDVSSVLNRMRKTALSLLTAEIQLAKNELLEEFTAEVLFTRRVILASALIVIGATFLILGVLIAIAKFIPLWFCAIVTGALMSGVGVVSLMSAWKRHASISTITNYLKDSLDFSDIAK